MSNDGIIIINNVRMIRIRRHLYRISINPARSNYFAIFVHALMNLKLNLGERNMNKRSCRDNDRIFFVTKLKSEFHFSLGTFYGRTFLSGHKKSTYEYVISWEEPQRLYP